MDDIRDRYLKSKVEISDDRINLRNYPKVKSRSGFEVTSFSHPPSPQPPSSQAPSLNNPRSPTLNLYRLLAQQKGAAYIRISEESLGPSERDEKEDEDEDEDEDEGGRDERGR
uniref:Uncharacterized protein n=1 Tax=Vespula pensylvanica TaxID=30213 RepID=A0A834JZM3_VESPE|nr:hypothetical protein H0235_016657 [Vespula pensylvanica]